VSAPTLSGGSRIDAATGFTIDHLSDAGWREKGLRSFMHYRDLGLTEATSGRLRAEHIRTHKPGAQGTGWHCHDLDFQFVYVLNGFVEFTAEGHGDIRLEAGGCAHIPPFTMHDETRFSDDFEVLEITIPAVVQTLAKKPEDRAGRPDAKFAASHLGPDSFAPGVGPRSFLEYRELGVTDATDGRIQIQVVRTNGPCDASTGWHYHTLEHQFVYILGGWVRTELEGYGEFLLERGDAMSVPARHKHDVTGFSDDFQVLELNAPAEFETVSVAAPAPR